MNSRFDQSSNIRGLETRPDSFPSFKGDIQSRASGQHYLCSASKMPHKDFPKADLTRLLERLDIMLGVNANRTSVAMAKEFRNLGQRTSLMKKLSCACVQE